VRKANIFLWIAGLVLLAGFAVGQFLPPTALTGGLSLASILIGIYLWQVSQFFTRRWSPRFRQDAVLERALKSLDNRYSLFSFADPRLPDYLLLGPHGVRVLVARGVGGTVRCRRDQWSRVGASRLGGLFFGNPVRNPTVEAVQSIAKVQDYLQRELPEAADQIPVSATIVFTDPKVELEIESSQYPVVRARDVRAQVQREKGPLGPPQIARLRQLLSPPVEATLR
jgi:hypothetical protein